ncbi:MAG: bifunctional UDP-N-acetylglucosamine diphosphorylase/glucosamine-1-phosphate N-acetyltransferase GlmU [Dehalococcoidia bacterium]|nr:bifunctional UDP-N-acetylglucosamine diphosphorylase/glucosamine-1-phosphate N-acetyltransferase GlmU [Dehalococcoidia bacterium]
MTPTQDQPHSTPLEATPLEGWVAVVLAAGRGTRMRSALPKVLHPVAGRPMVDLVLDTLAEAGCADVVVVTANAGDEVPRAVEARARVAIQDAPLGTGHAALAARAAAGEASRVLIVNADLPLLRAETVRALIEGHDASDATLTFLTAHVWDPTGYGRVVREGGRVRAIVEQSDADAETAAYNEVNVGLYAASAGWLWPTLEALTPGPRGERYLTDIVARAIEAGLRVETHTTEDPSEAQQVNTRVELARAEITMRDRVHLHWMTEGVTLIDPATTYIDVTVELAEDTTILPGVHLSGRTRVGRGTRIGPNAIVRDMVIGADCEVGASTLEGSTLGDRVSVGPYCHVRPGSTIESDAHLGNYAEVKASRIGAHTAVGHFSYIGDADIGARVNIGAGTITANFDGVTKHRTTVGDDAFIGSDSLLIAPVEVGARARTAGGSVVTRDVDADTTVIGVPARPHPAEHDDTSQKEDGPPSRA